MNIEFCPKCGSPFEVTKSFKKTFFTCKKCGLRKETGKGVVTREELTHELKGEGSVDEGNEFANYKNICKKCGYNKAQIIDVGILYSDEDNLILLRCGKCGFSERIGRKVT